jgi:hypothetical protein
MKKSVVGALALALVAAVPVSAHGQEGAGPTLDPPTCTPTDAHPCRRDSGEPLHPPQRLGKIVGPALRRALPDGPGRRTHATACDDH